MNGSTQLWLALSRAFLPPIDRDVARALSESLAADLAELCRESEVDAAADIGALAVSLEPLGSPDALLVHYSGLFLPPSARTTLNLSMHLDGTLNGAAMDDIESVMARHGAERAEGFRDMPDHLAAMLELLALILATADADEAGSFARRLLLPALPHLEEELAQSAGDSPYLHLVRIAMAGLARYRLPETPARRLALAEMRVNSTPGVWRACRACGRTYAREKEIRIMARALEQHGLPADHLELCVDCRLPGASWIPRASSGAASP